MADKLLTDDPYPRCWLCGKNGSSDRLDRHHIFHGPNRPLSEKYGLCVMLCHSSCHETGRNAVHRSGETDRELKMWGQRKAMNKYGWSEEEFVQIFGKNYL